ncbi:MAG: hypothetical protein HGA96_13520 [Desulfobulbaceae bacterium]|nr:hypothetical protein [Desulfobulbaceae bacterium]
MKLKFFLLGVGASMMMLFLTGAMNDPGAPSSANLAYGRYQISSWATSFGDKGGAVGAFVIDTFSGETKTVYSRTYGPTMEGEVLKNDLKKPFTSMQ